MKSKVTAPRSAFDLFSYLVTDPQQEEVGVLFDLIVDQATGRIAFTILCVEDEQHQQDRLLALPWAALKIDVEHECCVLAVSREVLKRAPCIDEEDLPQDWTEDAYGAFIRALTAYFESPSAVQGLPEDGSPVGKVPPSDLLPNGRRPPSFSGRP